MDAAWRFAVDCVMQGRCAALADADHLEPRLVFQALNYGLSYSRHDDPKGSGYITTAEARTVMEAWDSAAPAEAGPILTGFMRPMSVKPEGRAVHWPINRGHDQTAELAAWGLILGIERGWFSYDRAGFLQWSQAGRDRYAAGDAAVVVDSITGQSAFAF